MNIVPLFETIADLRACSHIMDELLNLPLYRKLLETAAAFRKSWWDIRTATKTEAT